MRRRSIKILLLLPCVLFIAALFLFLDPLSRKAMNFAAGNLRASTLAFSNPSFTRATFHALDMLAWEQFSVSATAVSADSKTTRKATLKAQALTLEAVKPLSGVFAISLNNLSVSSEHLPGRNVHPDTGIAEVLQDAHLTAILDLDLARPGGIRKQLRDFAFGVKLFMEEGKTSVPIRFSAKEVITIDNTAYAVRLYSQAYQKGYRLVANREDLKAISGRILPKNVTSTAADLEIIAENPTKAPRLLRIRAKASNTAAGAHRKNPNVPEDAFRHILWSYLLTREFGSEFAGKVTAAHELTTDPEERKWKAGPAHRQDYHNNAIGRRYAELGYAESQILDLVMHDPNVIRDMPSQAANSRIRRMHQ